ncbi:hypothetical protein OIU84_029043 [Salix udensis]|uniref:Secreted protein n=1 Tax=Salix udensis TaxID=889485 RepID=A0AAD6KE75_9ROSI|nr:hypothetical protein OIU84_029043 [Salix udensis]
MVAACCFRVFVCVVVAVVKVADVVVKVADVVVKVAQVVVVVKDGDLLLQNTVTEAYTFLRKFVAQEISIPRLGFFQSSGNWIFNKHTKTKLNKHTCKCANAICHSRHLIAN